MPTLAVNKLAKRDYFILETFEAGVVLTGPEVKSVKHGSINLKGSYISLDKSSQAWLIGCHIAAYKPAGGVQKKYDPYRKKKLLLQKKEIHSLVGKSQERGLTILPISVYTKGSFVKIEIAIGRGKKKYDKRETIKKRDIDRDIRAQMKQKM